MGYKVCGTYALVINADGNQEEAIDLLIRLRDLVNQHTVFDVYIDDEYSDPVMDGEITHPDE